ncbi:TnpV protein [Cellulomonas triticagri]|uniref:TnpV protein n=1 Tax=Cellulomonas triticagri TaxID=2483352 RepID=A0A3M2JRB3_9CELL|nr:TnpV protein [Cellulomonas triticagri]RMI13225.1 TnpV protein [Cellulomonas triticagri]
MSGYASTARMWWQEQRPVELAEMDDPTAFFADLAQQIEARVSELSASMAGPDVPGEGYLSKVGRLNAARSQAVEAAMDELVFSIGPESDPVEEPSQIGTAVLDAHRMVARARG